MIAKGRIRFSSCSLPEELIEQIIARVPCIKSILRCTSVCKSWYAFINSTHFINFHLSLIPNNNHIPKFLLCEYDEAEIPSYATIVDGIEAFQDSTYFVRHEHDHDVSNHENFQGPYFAIHNDDEAFQKYYCLDSPGDLLQVHGCNGLICFNTSHHPNCLYLWNPSIAKLKTLPAPLVSNHDNDLSHSVFKLWFDNKTNDYKILRISYSTKTCTVEVYSLATNSWKLITDHAPITTSFLNSNRLAHVNGIFYWPVLRDGNWTLISLDMEDWTFRERLTTWPASHIYLRPSGDDHTLVILGYGDKDEPLLDLCGICSVFEVYDHSLNKFHTIDIEDAHRIEVHQPLGFRNNGELLFQYIYDNLEIVAYSPETKKFKEFVPTTIQRLLRTIPFVETLALFNDAEAIRI